MQKLKNQKKIQEFIRENSELFWYIKDDEKKNISEEFLVETILNFGNIKSTWKLFKLLSIRKVAGIFYHQLEKKRHNYLKLTEHFFRIYFERNVRKSA